MSRMVITSVSFFLALGAATLSAQEAPLLRYGWQAGETIGFRVEIETETDEAIETLKGTPLYTVKKADEDGLELVFRGGLGQSRKIKPQPGRFPRFRPPRIRSPFSVFTGTRSGTSELSIDPRGEVVAMKGTSQLPFLLGNLSQLMIEPLPESAQKSWEVTEETSISESSGRIPLPPGLRNQSRNVTPATERYTYRILESDEETATIEKTYTLETKATEGGKPRYEIRGKGKLVFDLKAGGPRSLEFEQRVITRKENVSTETPVKISYTRISDEERQQIEREAQARLEAAREAAEKLRQERDRPLTAEAKAELLEDLKSDNLGTLVRRLIELGRKKPQEPDQAIAEALVTLVEHKNPTVRRLAEQALEKWSPKDEQ